MVDLVYKELRSRILRGEVTSGQRLAQGELAELLGVSRTPVREALRRLTGEGLVEFRTNYGFSVAETQVSGMLHRMEVRAMLEPGIAALAATRRSQADLEAMHAAIEEERTATLGRGRARRQPPVPPRARAGHRQPGARARWSTACGSSRSGAGPWPAGGSPGNGRRSTSRSTAPSPRPSRPGATARPGA